jgi:hypothetical protein
MNHRVHHARNPEYIDRNYGGFFILWDRLFGTYQAEESRTPIDYGITRGLNSWNPLWANLHVYVDMIRDTIRTPRLGDKIGIWFGRTDFVPPGVHKPPVTPGNHYDPQISHSLSVYVGVQFAGLVAVGLSMTYLSGQWGRPGLSLLFAYLLVSLVTLGWLLDRDKPQWEWLRLLISLLLIPLLPLPPWLMTLLPALVFASALAFFFVCRINGKESGPDPAHRTN